MRRFVGCVALVFATAVPVGCGTADPLPGSATDVAPSAGSASPNSATPMGLPAVGSPLARPQHPDQPGPKPTRWPAAAAGGACKLLDFGVVEQTTGTSFEVAASGQQDATYTCVLRGVGASVPDLLLAVTPTSADPAVFRNTVMPKDATVLTGLGKVGYRLTVPAAASTGRGPSVEIGWLSGNNQIMALRYTLPANATPAAAQELAPKLIELAKTVDQATK